MGTIYLDESAYKGEALLRPDQPVFVICTHVTVRSFHADSACPDRADLDRGDARRMAKRALPDRRPQWTEADPQRVLEEWQRSGEAARTFRTGSWYQK